MNSLRKGTIALDAEVIDHLECCLGCRACESACPSGVRYELMLNETKARIYGEKPPPFFQRFLLQKILPFPRRMSYAGRLVRLYQRWGLQRLLAALLKGVQPTLWRMNQQLPEIPSPRRFEHFYPAYGQRRYRVSFLTGCVMPVLLPQVHHATIELLRRAGCDVLLPGRQTCCGALHIHSGDQQTALKLASENVKVFLRQEVDAILTNSAGCGSVMREYEHLLHTQDSRRFAAKVQDVLSFLDSIAARWEFLPFPLRVAYDDACHLLHGQRVSVPPRRLLGMVPSLELLSPPNSDRCCGSAGIYNLIRPQMADQLLEQKISELLSAGPERIATANPGCILQIQWGLRRRGVEIPVQHPVEILYEAIQGSRETE